MKKPVRKALLTAKLYRPGKAGGGSRFVGDPDAEGKIYDPIDRDINLGRFLRGSKNIDAEGDHRKLYHATSRDFSTFKPGGFDPNLSGEAIWLSPRKDRQPAAHNVGYADEGYKEGTNVMPLWGSIKNPLVLRNSHEAKAFCDQHGLPSYGFPLIVTPEHRAKLMELGHDGVFWQPGTDEEEVVALHPGQLKSATGNQGTFDPNEDDINKAAGGRTGYADGGMPQLKTDNPGGQWLQDKIEDAQSRRQSAKPDTYEATLGTGSGVTGWFKGDYELPVDMLKGIPGSMGEEKFRDTGSKLKYLKESIAKHGYKPDAILVHVREDGQPFIVEGNHRVAEAIQSGRKTIPGEIKYLRGSEAVDGPLHPKKVLAALTGRTGYADGGSLSNDALENFYGPTADEHRGRWYTGTSKDKDFTAFQESRHGTWLTRDPADASQYAMQNDSQDYVRDPEGKHPWSMKKTNTASRVIPAFVRVENPYTGPRPDSTSDNYKKFQSDWFDQLRAQGYDAWAPKDNPNLLVKLKNQGTHIKSAIGNSGAYDMSKKHLAKREGGYVVDKAMNLARNLTRR